MESVKIVAMVTPVSVEPLWMLQQFAYRIRAVGEELNEGGVGFLPHVLDDSASSLPKDGLSGLHALISHPNRLGLAQTLVDGYKAAVTLEPKPDLVIRLDAQEHPVELIPEIVDYFVHAQVDALFCPVWYWAKGEPRSPRHVVDGLLVDFRRSLAPVLTEIVLGVYNQKFPMGYQAFRREFLERLIPRLDVGLTLFEEIAKKKPTWGLDLLAILLAADMGPDRLDCFFGGWAEPWQENRPPEKIKEQQERAAIMLEVARKLGCQFAE